MTYGDILQRGVHTRMSDACSQGDTRRIRLARSRLCSNLVAAVN